MTSSFVRLQDNSPQFVCAVFATFFRELSWRRKSPILTSEGTGGGDIPGFVCLFVCLFVFVGHFYCYLVVPTSRAYEADKHDFPGDQSSVPAAKMGRSNEGTFRD